MSTYSISVCRRTLTMPRHACPRPPQDLRAYQTWYEWQTASARQGGDGETCLVPRKDYLGLPSPFDSPLGTSGLHASPYSQPLGSPWATAGGATAASPLANASAVAIRPYDGIGGIGAGLTNHSPFISELGGHDLSAGSPFGALSPQDGQYGAQPKRRLSSTGAEPGSGPGSGRKYQRARCVCHALALALVSRSLTAVPWPWACDSPSVPCPGSPAATIQASLRRRTPKRSCFVLRSC